MKLLITGVCGFVGSSLAQSLLERRDGISIWGIDNLMRPGSELNRARLLESSVHVLHGDIRVASDFESVPAVDWVIDAAANPSVLAGIQSGFSSRQLMEHNLNSVVNVLEYCKTHHAGLLLMSTSRVYSIDALRALPLRRDGNAFCLDETAALPQGVSGRGIGAGFSTRHPISLYGSTKLAAEVLALEYGEAFGFPVWINRCGVLAGAGQFGTPDQGVFSYWIHAHARRRPLRYIGFDGTGQQTRDIFHPRDLAVLADAQMSCRRAGGQRLYCAGGGPSNAISLRQLTHWCDARFGHNEAVPDTTPRPYDIPWVSMDSSDAQRDFDWRIEFTLPSILEEIARHADRDPDWLEKSGLARSGLEKKRDVNEMPPQGREPLRLLSVVIPARDEEGRVGATVEHLYVELRLHGIEHEIVVVDDGSTDGTWLALEQARDRVPTLHPVRNTGEHGFGRAVSFGLEQARGDAMVVMMADESDDCRDVVRYWDKLNEGWDAVFGSRFVRGGGVIDYPRHKLILNRLANLFLRVVFHVPLNDFTNAFKAYRRKVIEGCQPFLSPHFNLTIEIPLKTIVRGYSWTVIPITWRNRQSGESKLKIREMGSRYLFIALYCWLEKSFSRGDYIKRNQPIRDTETSDKPTPDKPSRDREGVVP